MIGIVLRKELKDVFRDRKTLFLSLLLPMVLFPVLYMVLGGSMNHASQQFAVDVRVAYGENLQAAPVRALVEDMLSGKGIALVEGDGLALLKAGDVEAVLNASADAEARVAAGQAVDFTIVCDQTKSLSSTTATRIEQSMSEYNQRYIDKTLQELGIDMAALKRANVTTEDLAQADPTVTREGEGNPLLAGMLPILLLTFLAMGGSAVACDLIAGEKERQTLEPLLATSASRSAILVGKYLTVCLFALISGIFTVAGFLFSFISPDARLLLGSSSFALGISGVSVALLIVIILGLAMTFAALLLTISAMARNLKEAQTYTSLLPIVVMIPSYATLMMQAGDFSLGMMAVPLLGQVGAIKMLLAGMLSWPHLLAALASTLVTLALALAVSARMLGRETVLLR